MTGYVPEEKKRKTVMQRKVTRTRMKTKCFHLVYNKPKASSNPHLDTQPFSF